MLDEMRSNAPINSFQQARIWRKSLSVFHHGVTGMKLGSTTLAVWPKNL
jgi:hypothetical protein